MSFTVEKVYHPHEGEIDEVLFKITYDKFLRTPCLSLTDTEIHENDIDPESDLEQLYDWFSDFDGFRKLLLIKSYYVEVMARLYTSDRTHSPEKMLEYGIRQHLAYFLCERIFIEIGAADVQYKDASEHMRFLWACCNITHDKTLHECRGILYRLLKHNKNRNPSAAAKICLAKYYKPDTPLFDKVLRRVNKQKLPEEKLLHMLALRLVREKQT